MKDSTGNITFAKTLKQQKMKNIKTIILTATVAAMTAISSCSTDPCETKVCQNGGATKKISSDSCGCNCTNGFTGSNCENIDVAILNGTYLANDKLGTSTVPQYSTTLTISSSSFAGTITKIKGNFFTNQITATVSGKTITIADQQPDNDGYHVVGTGTITPGTGTSVSIAWTYSITGPNGATPPVIVTDNFTGTWTK